jgi:lysophospholipase L1-like esterase
VSDVRDVRDVTGLHGRGRRWLSAVVALAAVLAGCSEGPQAAQLPPTPAEPKLTYVALGASDAIGFGADQPLTQAWPQLLVRSELPVSATFVNAAADGSTVAQALDRQLSLAESVSPDLATVSFGVNDLRAGVSAEHYEFDLGTLVHGVRRGGATRVLLGNVPPIDHLPAYLAAAGTEFPAPDVVVAAVDAYNAAVARVAAREGAELVDLHATGLAAREEGIEATLVSADGFHPSTAGHRRIAEAFAAVLG